MTLEYQAPPCPACGRTHDHVYSTLLFVLGFFLCIGIATLFWMRRLPDATPESRTALLIPMTVEACYLAAIFVVLCIRLFFPSRRRWPTLALNIILLIFFPLGTALAIYGLRKADRSSP